MCLRHDMIDVAYSIVVRKLLNPPTPLQFSGPPLRLYVKRYCPTRVRTLFRLTCSPPGQVPAWAVLGR